MRLRFAILLTLSLHGLLTGTVSAQTGGLSIRKTYSKSGDPVVSLEMSSLFERLPASGYHPVRVKIVNDSPDALTWQFDFESSDQSFGKHNRLNSQFSVTCNARSVAGVDLIVPVMSIFSNRYGNELQSSINVVVRPPAPFETSSDQLTTEISTASPKIWPSVIYSERIKTPNGPALDSATEDHLYGPSSRGSSYRGNTFFGGSFVAKFMPDDWRAYCGYDACLLTDEDWNELPPGARNALRKWNRLGGALIIYNTIPGTDLKTLGLVEDAGESSAADPGWGTALLKPLPSDGRLEAAEVVKMVENAVKKTGGGRVSDLRQNFLSSWKIQEELGEKTSQIITVIIVLVLFGILVGPINLFVFAGAGKRHKLFISTPLISLGASVVLLALILLQDGFGGSGRRIVLREIGPDNTTYISQEQVARTGILLTTGFTTEEPCYLSPVALGESRWARVTDKNSGGFGRYNLDLTADGLKATGDWFKSSSEHGHIFETIRPSRERISLAGASENPAINSTFGFPLGKVFYRDTGGQLWTTSDVEQGRNTSMTAVDENEFTSWFNEHQMRFGPRNRARLELSRDKRGYFYGFADDSEGIASLSSLKWKKAPTFITGQISARGRSNP